MGSAGGYDDVAGSAGKGGGLVEAWVSSRWTGGLRHLMMCKFTMLAIVSVLLLNQGGKLVHPIGWTMGKAINSSLPLRMVNDTPRFITLVALIQRR